MHIWIWLISWFNFEYLLNIERPQKDISITSKFKLIYIPTIVKVVVEDKIKWFENWDYVWYTMYVIIQIKSSNIKNWEKFRETNLFTKNLHRKQLMTEYVSKIFYVWVQFPLHSVRNCEFYCHRCKVCCRNSEKLWAQCEKAKKKKEIRQIKVQLQICQTDQIQ